jgi:hypothetical protein
VGRKRVADLGREIKFVSILSKSYRPFEHLLGGDAEAIEISEPIDMGRYMEDDIDAIKGLKKTAVIHGWIKIPSHAQHHSRSDVCPRVRLL